MDTGLLLDNLIKLENELRELENEIQIQFGEDLGRIKRSINLNRISNSINFKKFEDDFYLYKTAPYLDTQIPDTNNKTDLANLYIYKEVDFILRYIHQRLIRNIRSSLHDYERR
jgi:hypothetical protein